MGSPRWLRDAERIDLAVYAAIAATSTPALDQSMRRLSRAANHSKVSLAVSALLVTCRGEPGRRAGRAGLASIAATSAIANAVIKPLGRRRRPDIDADVPLARQVRMPRSRSFPSGHAASAFAFATAVGQMLPGEAVALHSLAALVSYSRVHTGVHYPGDVIAGALLGSAIARLTTRALEHARA